MQQIREISLENKTLRKQLNREYSNMYYEMCFYLRLHDLTTIQYNEITNKILIDLNRRQNESEKILDSIDNPKDYIDYILVEYHVQKSNYIMNLLRRYGPILIGFISIYYIKSDLFLPVSERITNTVNIGLMRIGVNFVLYASLVFLYYRQLFVQKKKVLLPIIVFLIYTASLMYLESINGTMIDSFSIPILVPYVLLGLSVLIKVIDRKRLWL